MARVLDDDELIGNWTLVGGELEQLSGRLVDVSPGELGLYEWDGRTIKAHRADIRRYFGFRECSVADADKAAEWLAVNVCEKERQVDQVREELLAHGL